jgi:hypothetical protein
VWERPRPVRTEKIAIDTGRLAKRACAQMGLVCVHAVPVAEGTLLTVCTVDDGEWRTKADTPDHFLFRTEQDLNKIIDEMVTLEAMFWTASRVEGGVLLNVAVDRIADVIAECLK